LIETDAPYLAPVPHRGKRNEPAFLPIIAEFVAGLKGILVKQLVETTWQNANALFGLEARLTRNFSSQERSNKTENGDAA
jgi:TatD DNase family protein